VQSIEAINLVEVVLRELIREVIGEDWQSIGDVDLDRLRGALKNETDRRRGAIVPTDLLDFADFVLLQLIIDQKWEHFGPVLKSRKNFKVYMDRLGAFRNTAMHSRVLLTFEEALVTGMTGEIRNQVTIWRSEQGPDMKYFPEIVSVTDSFGMQLRNGKVTETILRPGQTVTFRCAGTDPHGRLLRWELRVVSRGGSMIMEDARKGDEVTLTWEVVDNHIRENADIWITMWSDSPHHRHGEYDERYHLHYHALPPVTGDPGRDPLE